MVERSRTLDRRTLLQLTSAAALASCAPRQRKPTAKVVVVGAGIVGASIAYHLSKAGATVTVLDMLGPATQCSRGTFAWINATWAKQPRPYHALNQAGLSGWKSLQDELGIPVKWGGSLEWFDNADRQHQLAEQIAEQQAWGEPAQMLLPEQLSQLEPKVNFTGTASAAYSGNDGAVDPELATLTLLEAAKANGAIVKYPCELLDVSISNGNLQSVDTTLGAIDADKLILATGAAPNAAKKFADIELPQRTTPGIIAITKPMPKLLNRLVIAPGVHLHQRLDGRVVLGEQSGAPDNEAHAIRLKGRPVAFPAPAFAEQHFLRMLNVATQFVPDLVNAEAEAVHIGWRPLPIDGHPVLGFSPARKDVYLAIMHSGVSLAPIIGQLVTQEIITDMPNEQLSDYRPDRVFNTVRRY